MHTNIKLNTVCDVMVNQRNSICLWMQTKQFNNMEQNYNSISTYISKTLWHVYSINLFILIRYINAYVYMIMWLAVFD